MKASSKSHDWDSIPHQDYKGKAFHHLSMTPEKCQGQPVFIGSSETDINSV